MSEGSLTTSYYVSTDTLVHTPKGDALSIALYLLRTTTAFNRPHCFGPIRLVYTTAWPAAWHWMVY